MSEYVKVLANGECIQNFRRSQQKPQLRHAERSEASHFTMYKEILRCPFAAPSLRSGLWLRALAQNDGQPCSIAVENAVSICSLKFGGTHYANSARFTLALGDQQAHCQVFIWRSLPQGNRSVRWNIVRDGMLRLSVAAQFVRKRGSGLRLRAVPRWSASVRNVGVKCRWASGPIKLSGEQKDLCSVGR